MTESSTSSSLAEALHEKLTARTARVGVVGLGYVGLPLAVEFARAGFDTTGIDLDADKVAAINRGESYIQDVPGDDVARFSSAQRLRATTHTAAIASLDTINICVPTPLRKTKDPRSLLRRLGRRGASRSISDPASSSSSSPPPIQVLRTKSCGRFSSARVCGPATTSSSRSPRSASIRATRNGRRRTCPKWSAARRPRARGWPKALYSASIDTVVEVSSPNVAEMVKLLENTFRAVNIGLVNELALMCDRLGISVWEVIDAASTKPFGFMPFYPGPGLGGHCIPIDPFYLSWKVKEVGFEARFIELAGHVNGAMPHHVVDKVSEALNSHRKAINGSQVLVLGVAYKRDIEDFRESPALDVMAAMAAKGARLSFHDPYVPTVAAQRVAGRVRPVVGASDGCGASRPQTASSS